MKSQRYLLIIIFLFSGCSDFELFKGVPIRQYASKVIRYSSQYSSNNWSAARALGKENVYPSHGDLPNAWASVLPDSQREYLELGFDTLQTVRTVQIFETYNPGAIDTVFLRDSNTKKWTKIYSKPADSTLKKESRIFTIQMLETTFFTDAIRIAINSPAIDGWNEIDAVAITGQRQNVTK